jgi:hypothetical protein
VTDARITAGDDLLVSPTAAGRQQGAVRPSVTLTSTLPKEAAAHQARADALIWVGAICSPAVLPRHGRLDRGLSEEGGGEHKGRLPGRPPTGSTVKVGSADMQARGGSDGVSRRPSPVSGPDSTR